MPRDSRKETTSKTTYWTRKQRCLGLQEQPKDPQTKQLENLQPKKLKCLQREQPRDLQLKQLESLQPKKLKCLQQEQSKSLQLKQGCIKEP
jgi:hypothetical protein